MSHLTNQEDSSFHFYSLYPSLYPHFTLYFTLSQYCNCNVGEVESYEGLATLKQNTSIQYGRIEYVIRLAVEEFLQAPLHILGESSW